MSTVLERLDAEGLARRRRVIGANVRAAREAIGMTQGQLGQALGHSRVAVNRWEQGHAEPTDDTLAQLAHALRVPVEQLLTVR